MLFPGAWDPSPFPTGSFQGYHTKKKKKNMDYLKAKYFKIHSISLYVFMCTCVCEGVPRDQKRGVRSLGAGVIDICELPDMGAEI